MTIYFRGPTVLITDQALEVGGPSHYRFAIIDLYDIHVVRGRWRLGGREQELRASYHGYVVRLFSSRDERLFGQVRRALLRATEAHV
jgi:hypothetical protein